MVQSQTKSNGSLSLTKKKTFEIPKPHFWSNEVNDFFICCLCNIN